MEAIECVFIGTTFVPRLCVALVLFIPSLTRDSDHIMYAVGRGKKATELLLLLLKERRKKKKDGPPFLHARASFIAAPFRDSSVHPNRTKFSKRMSAIDTFNPFKDQS